MAQHKLTELKQAADARQWKHDAVVTIMAATRGDWLIELLSHVERQDTKARNGAMGGTKLVLNGVNILAQVTTHTAKSALVQVAMECEAPVHEKAWGDIRRNKADVALAYAALKEMLVEFNDQMRKATKACMAMQYQMASRAFSGFQQNPWEGVAVWQLMEGASGRTRVRIDALMAELRQAADVRIERLVDLGAALGYVNEVATTLLHEGIGYEIISDIILPPLLNMVAEGTYAEKDRLDVKGWRRIGQIADDLKRRREQGDPVLWQDVYDALTNEIVDIGPERNKQNLSISSRGPGTSMTRPATKAPLGIMLSAMEDTYVDGSSGDSDMALAAATFSQPATVEDFRELMKRGTPLPAAKLAGQSAQRGGIAKAAPTQRKVKEEQSGPGKDSRKRRPKWTCLGTLSNGSMCGHQNYHYQSRDFQDATILRKCEKCGAARPQGTLAEQAMAAIKADRVKQAAATTAAGTSAQQRASEQAKAAVTDQQSEQGNAFGLAAVTGAPNFDGMRIIGSEDHMACCAQPIATEQQPQHPLKSIGCNDEHAEREEQSINGQRRQEWGPILWMLMYVYAAGSALAHTGMACIEAVRPSPLDMWRAVHGMQAALADQARSAKQAAWYVLLLLIMYAACANAQPADMPERASNSGTGLASRARHAFGAIFLSSPQRQHRQYCMLAANVKGPALFLDSCCNRTIISDESLLRDIRPLPEPRVISGLTGAKAIHQIGDLHMRMTNRDGQVRTEVIKDVYYDPGLPYNLVAMHDITEAEYTATFSAEQCVMSGPGGVFDLAKTTNRVYTMPINGRAEELMACAASSMSAEEFMHLKFNHAISYRRLAQMSRDQVPGIPAKLKEKKFTCEICQHANITRNDAPPAATGSDDADCHFDMADMSKIQTINGMRYCTIFMMTKTRYAYTYLHKTKDQAPDIMDQFLSQFEADARPRTFKSDCAEEYGTPRMQAVLAKHGITEPLRHSNEHQQFQNGKAEKFIDTLGRRMRATLLQSQLPPEFWGAAAVLMTDVYNCTPHDSLDGESPFKRAKGRHPDTSFIKPFGCGMVVHRGRDLVEHGKLAPRGEKCVYIGTGQAWGRRAYLAFSPRVNRIYATVDAQFDECYFPFRLVDQRVFGQHAKQPKLEQLSLFHDLPHPTIEQLITRINSAQVPGGDVTWNLSDLVQHPPGALDTEQHSSGERTGLNGERTGNGNSGDSGERTGPPQDPYGITSTAAPTDAERTAAGADAGTPVVTGANLRILKQTVFAQGPPGAYGETMRTDAWRRGCSKTISDLGNDELGECLIGMEAQIKCPERYWPSDKVSWTVQVMEHHADGRSRGGHRFLVALQHSQPAYRYKPGEPQQYEAMLSAYHLRTALTENHDADTKTLQQMFGERAAGSNIAAAAYDVINRVQRAVKHVARRTEDKIRIVESAATAQAALITMVCTAMICDDEQVQYAGLRPEPRHFYDIQKRPDADRWYAACDKEIIKLFDMGAFDIVDTPRHKKVMECCFSFKTKYDSDGNVLEYRARGNVDGSKQEPGTFGETFAPTSKFSCIRTICALAAQEGMHLYQFDIKGAFLMAPCKEDIYINFPGRYRLPPGKCLKCRSYVYGLKQSAARWHELFSGWLIKYGFTNLDDDGVTFMKRQHNAEGTESKIILSMHVDDGLAASNDPVMYAAFLDALRQDFDLSDCGELSWLLGCKVEQDSKAGTVRLTQEKYCNDILKRFQMHDCTPVATPCEANMHLSDDDCPPLQQRDPEVVRNYQQCVGACMYLTCFTRGDCSFAVNQCARFMHNPGPTHIAAIKRVLRYLAGTRNRGITYRRDAPDPAALAMGKHVGANQITASADADHAGAKDRRSISGYAIMLAGAMVMWTSKRQPVTAISSTESEFYSVSQCALD